MVVWQFIIFQFPASAVLPTLLSDERSRASGRTTKFDERAAGPQPQPLSRAAGPRAVGTNFALSLPRLHGASACNFARFLWRGPKRGFRGSEEDFASKKETHGARRFIFGRALSAAGCARRVCRNCGIYYFGYCGARGCFRGRKRNRISKFCSSSMDALHLCGFFLFLGNVIFKGVNARIIVSVMNLRHESPGEHGILRFHINEYV